MGKNPLSNAKSKDRGREAWNRPEEQTALSHLGQEQDRETEWVGWDTNGEMNSRPSAVVAGRELGGTDESFVSVHPLLPF